MRATTKAGFAAATLLLTLLPALSHCQSQAAPRPQPEVQALLDQWLTAYRSHDVPGALRIGAEAVARARTLSDLEGEATALLRLGLAQDQASERDKAIASLGQSLDLYRKTGDRRGEASALLDTGNAYWSSHKPGKALPFYEQALPLYRAVGDRRAEAGALGCLGAAYRDSGQLGKALAFFEQAIDLSRTIGAKGSEANGLHEIAGVYRDTGQRAKSRESLARALALYVALRDRAGAGRLLNNLGVLCADDGEPQQALGYHLRALQLDRELGDRSGEALNLANIAGTYHNIGQQESALAYYAEALEAARAAGDKEDEAIALSGIANCWVSAHQHAKAVQYAELALRVARTAGMKKAEIDALESLGTLCYRTGRMPRALECAQQDLILCRSLGYGPGEANALHLIGNIYSDTGRLPAAVASYRQASALKRVLGQKEGEAAALTDMGIAYAALHRSVQAEGCFRQAVALVEGLRPNLGSLLEAKMSLGSSHRLPYVFYLDRLARRGRSSEGFALAQKMKARALLDLLRAGGADLLNGSTDEERVRVGELRARADSLNRQMVAQGVLNEVGSKRRYAEARVALRQTEAELARLFESVAARQGSASMARSAETLSAGQVARLLPEDTVILEYAALHAGPGKHGLDGVCLFTLTSSGLTEVHRLPITGAELGRMAARLRDSCADPRQPFRREARRLFRALIGPAEPRLRGKRRLVICPDGPTWDVPFAALLDASGRPLLSRFELVEAYSATGLAALLQARAGKRRGPPLRTAMVVADPRCGTSSRFGDVPDLPGQRPIDAPSRPIDAPSRPIDAPSRPIDAPSRPIGAPTRSVVALPAPLYVPRGASLKSLPGARREAAAILANCPGAAVYMGETAQEQTVKAEAGKYRFLHFATHGFFNDAAPLQSSLVLAEPPAGSPDDGFLTAREIMDLRLSAEMVVLSACNTARGEKRSGEGIVGMTWALSGAGVPSQVVSQWSVDDASTAALMARFYAGLRGGEGKAQALRRAALSLRRDGKHSHPYYWAPFILMGDWRGSPPGKTAR